MSSIPGAEGAPRSCPAGLMAEVGLRWCGVDAASRPPTPTPPAMPAATPYEPGEHAHDDDGERNLYPERSAEDSERNLDTVTPWVRKRVGRPFNSGRGGSQPPCQPFWFVVIRGS